MNTPIIGDLHFHTTDSDGIRTNAEIIEKILTLDPERQGIWAVTNHDRFSPGFVDGARAEGIQAVWATEISTHSDDLNLSLHVTCYSSKLSESIRQIVEGIVIARNSRIRGQIAKLRENGFPIDEARFFSWIEEQRMSPESATNWHITEYIWKQKDTLAVAAELTNGTVKSALDFLRECLRENGDFAHIGYHQIPRYEPELDILADIAKKEDLILSIAHPNFSFTKKLQKEYHAKNSEERTRLFASEIVPAITDAGVRNYEINALAASHWVGVIRETVMKTGGYITFGSDNHGLEHMDSKHGIFGTQNPLLTREMSTPIINQIRKMI